AVQAVLDGSFADDEKPNAALALGRDRVSDIEDALLEGVEQPLQIAIGQASEEPDLAQELNGDRHESVSLTAGIRARSLDTTPEPLDLPFGALELRRAEAVELLAPLPELQGLVETGFSPLEPFDDLRQLLLRLLVRHSTLAGNEPSAVSTAIESPGATLDAE